MYHANMDKDTIISILENQKDNIDPTLLEKACAIRDEIYGRNVYLRGLVEFTNYCKNACFYCGLQSNNKELQRYRLSKEEILSCCEEGYALGFRTFVLQGGEDAFYTDDILCDIIREIRNKYTNCAITLSFGEKTYDTYQKYFSAGANRYLLRHETITKSHYEKLHPSYMKIENRVECLENLKEIGFQVGAGIMIGSPYQTIENIADDLLFLRNFNPHMVGIGPFLPQSKTIFKDMEKGSLNLTLLALALTRILLPNVLLPATTALASLSENGRKMGLMAGCNVVMPNLSPNERRKDYALYDNKISWGNESALGVKKLVEEIEAIGLNANFSRGDYILP